MWSKWDNLYGSKCCIRYGVIDITSSFNCANLLEAQEVAIRTADRRPYFGGPQKYYGSNRGWVLYLQDKIDNLIFRI